MIILTYLIYIGQPNTNDLTIKIFHLKICEFSRKRKKKFVEKRLIDLVFRDEQGISFTRLHQEVHVPSTL